MVALNLLSFSELSGSLSKKSVAPRESHPPELVQLVPRVSPGLVGLVRATWAGGCLAGVSSAKTEIIRRAAVCTDRSPLRLLVLVSPPRYKFVCT